MFKIYKRTIHIGTTGHPQRLKYKVEQNSGSSVPNILTIPAAIAGAVLGILAFSVFFAVLLIPLGIVGFRAWRLMRTVQQQTGPQSDAGSLTAEYTVISDKDKH
ncbi:MAG: hypothetical protein M0R33_20260 [Methylomonas sp.]|jgi:hypothetical protein|uniref:hypothetical protein n=1 Tax=Methylomonas sp. TaxID=418 RepID=UPI0025EB9F06|nr:hypothetical protein [Methylomonas sp.]MCK9608779.1 hypothetical protein [Methylomonas sp.]